MKEVIGKILGWIMGESPEGQRKLVYCARVELMLFVLMLFIPDVEVRKVTVDAMVWIAGIGVGGNGVEWVSKAVVTKKGA